VIKKLLSVRWVGQFTDGIFQTGLASFVLFSPERQPNAMAAAVAFAVVLLPYSLIGPFVGTILDRISRSRILAFANLSRALALLLIAWLVHNGATGIVLTCVVLIAFGVNRLILAGLSAGLPLLVDRNRLMGINALAVTGGTVAVVIGGGVGIGLRRFLDSHTNADFADAGLIIVAAGMYFVAALLAVLMPKKAIGPLPHELTRGTVRERFQELRDGLALMRKLGDVYLGIFATATHRFGLNALTLMTLLLERNTFNAPNDPEAGLAGLALAISVAGVGIGIGAVIAPFGVSQFGRHAWIRAMLFCSGLLPIFLAISQTEIVLLATAFFVGLCGQCVKVTNDALVQSKVPDQFRGRVFAVYDVIMNVAIVSGALVAAIILPTSGLGATTPLIVAGAYFVVSVGVLRVKNFHADKRPTT